MTDSTGLFLTDGNQRCALAIARALGRARVPVTVGESEESSLAGSSRFCAENVRYPSPLSEGPRFQEFLLERARSGRYRVLLPLTDITMRLVAEIRDELAAATSVPIPTLEQIAATQDKAEVLRLGQQVGLAIPQTCMTTDLATLHGFAARVGFPVVLKPRFSRVMNGGRWVTGPVEYADNPDQLTARHAAIHSRIPCPLVQERIEGEARGVFLLAWKGELKAAFCHRRLREKPPWGGVSVYRESMPLDATLVDRSFALLRSIGWQGAAMVEFKMDDRDGEAKLMEINGRFWGSLQLALDAGMNFPLMLYRLACGEDVPSSFCYRAGVRSRWVLGDLDQLLTRLRHPERMPDGQRSRLHACGEFLGTFAADAHNEVFRNDDLGPGWYECREYLRSLWN